MQIKPRTFNDKYFGGYTPIPRSMTSFVLGTTRQKQGHYRESLSAFDQAIAIDPKFAAAYVRRGESLLELDDHKAAMANFSKAIQLVPTDWLSYKLRGRIYFEQNEYEKAISDFSASIKYAKDPENKAEMYKNRGKMYANLGKHDLALADLTMSVNLEPFSARSALLLRGNEYYATKQYQKAVDDYTKSISYGDNKAQDRLYALRASAYEKLGKQDLARKDRLKAKDSVKDGWGDVLKDMDKRGF